MSGTLPAGNVQYNLPQSVINYYDKKFRENLKSETPFVACAERLDLPKGAGSFYNIFQYSPLAENTSQATEGNTGDSVVVSVIHTNFQIGEYADYANFSSLALAAAIDPVVENVRREMAYRLGQSLSHLVRTQAEAAIVLDGSVETKVAATSTSVYSTLSRNVLATAVGQMVGRAIRPPEGMTMFAGVMHPFALVDVQTDTGNNSPIDILKHTPQGLMRLEELSPAEQSEVVEIPGVNAKFFLSNKVTSLANYNPGGGAISGLTALRTYLFGRDGVFAVKLGANGDISFGDGRWQNVECYMEQNAPRSAFDPSGLIPGFTSYKVHFTTGNSPDSTQRLRIIDAASAVS